jgi:tRNA(fMet)-specific endonuclease VapC
MLLLFDTNIFLLYLRELPISEFIESKYKPFDSPNESIVSIITIAELKSIALQNNWGNSKLEKMEKFLSKFIILDVGGEDIINRYAEIDAFSQGRLNERVSNFTARNMGKNDIWIAATASVLDAMLLTTDNDFDHLNEEFLSVAKIDLTI